MALMRIVALVCSRPLFIRLVSHVIGHEGPGSLLSLLRQEGLALGLSCSTHRHPTFSLFFMSIQVRAVLCDGVIDVPASSTADPPCVVVNSLAADHGGPAQSGRRGATCVRVHRAADKHACRGA